MRKSVLLASATTALVGALTLSACGGSGVQQMPANEGQQSEAPVEANQADGEQSGGLFGGIGNKGISAEELEKLAAEDVEKTVNALVEEGDALIAEIDSFDSYVKNNKKVEAFYDKILAETDAIGIRMRQYSLDCAENILASGRTGGQMYDDLEVIYDEVYDSAGEDIYDEIYDELFETLYDAFYDGVIQDAYDSMGYGEWSEVHSDAYKIWSDVRSDVYKSISDFRSDIYDFGSDVRGDVFNDKLDKAQKEIEDFREDIEELKEEK